ncbi:MAG: LptF/LptG family permease, partial [Kiritimatiellaeota bacterium]|nr:LptF/LptG family permease [Kiritimatiellota bacterium]
ADGSLDWDLKAEKAEFIPGQGWLFTDGEITYFDKVNQLPGAPRKFRVIKKGLDEFPETPRDILNAVKHIEDLTSFEIYEILKKSTHMSVHRKSLYWTTFYYRLSFYPFAALIAALLGIPIATKNERSGIFLSIIIAVVIIVVYIVVSEVLRVFGNSGKIPPFIAGTTPTFLFLVFAWYNVVKQD